MWCKCNSLALRVGCQVASCLQLQDELSWELRGGQLGHTGTRVQQCINKTKKKKSPWPPKTSAGFWEESFILLFQAALAPEGSIGEQRSRSRGDLKALQEVNRIFMTHPSTELAKNKLRNNVCRSLSNTYSDRWRRPTFNSPRLLDP